MATPKEAAKQKIVFGHLLLALEIDPYGLL